MYKIAVMGDFEIPVEDGPEETGEEDNTEE